MAPWCSCRSQSLSDEDFQAVLIPMLYLLEAVCLSFQKRSGLCACDCSVVSKCIHASTEIFEFRLFLARRENGEIKEN